jgi:hypothetical protein
LFKVFREHVRGAGKTGASGRLDQSCLLLLRRHGRRHTKRPRLDSKAGVNLKNPQVRASNSAGAASTVLWFSAPINRITVSGVSADL